MTSKLANLWTANSLYEPDHAQSCRTVRDSNYPHVLTWPTFVMASAGRLSLAHARKSLAGAHLQPMERRSLLDSLPIHPHRGRPVPASVVAPSPGTACYQDPCSAATLQHPEGDMPLLSPRSACHPEEDFAYKDEKSLPQELKGRDRMHG